VVGCNASLLGVDDTSPLSKVVKKVEIKRNDEEVGHGGDASLRQRRGVSSLMGGVQMGKSWDREPESWGAAQLRQSSQGDEIPPGGRLKNYWLKA